MTFPVYADTSFLNSRRLFNLLTEAILNFSTLAPAI
jgi:hypothetical protein